MPDTILDAVLARPDAGPILLACGDGAPAERLGRDELLQRGTEVAAALRAMGVEPGDRIATFLPNGRTLLDVIVGAWMCRAAVVPLASTGSKRRSDLLLRRVAAVMQAAAPRVVVGTDEALAVVAAAGGAAGAHLLSEPAVAALRGSPVTDGFARPGDLALVQFTSGSTGTPRGVPVRHEQIVTNVHHIGLRSRQTPDDTLVSWLPLYHDMGFVGALCVPLLWGSTLALSTPERFIRNPAGWLRLISDLRGTVSPAPTFAFDVLGRLVPDHRLEGLDLSSWRYAWVGAEPVFQDHLRRFDERFRRRGLPEATLHPVYGLAEATLCVSAADAAERWRTLWVDGAALRERQAVDPVEAGREGGIALVANGPPLDIFDVRLAGDDGEPVEDHRVGRVWLRGPSVMSGYLGTGKRTGERTGETAGESGGAPGHDAGGWFDTGDLGFLHDGDLFITGRAKDVIIRAGVNIAPQDIEFAAQSVSETDVSRAAAFSCMRLEQAREEVVVVAETRRRGDAADELVAAIRARVLADVGLQIDRVELVAPGSIPRTTSGKVQRQLCRGLYLDNALQLPGQGEGTS